VEDDYIEDKTQRSAIPRVQPPTDEIDGNMKTIIGQIGNAAAIIGILVCLISGGARVMGSHFLIGYEAITLFNAGVGVMVFAALAKIHALGLTQK
jgi:hypothetical protein